MRRFSILSLMTFVAFLAVAFAALRDANPVWAGLMLLASLVLLGTALLGVVYGEGRQRAGWLGFALFDGCYLVLAIGPWLAESVGEKLPTTQLLHHVHSQVAASQQAFDSLTVAVMAANKQITPPVPIQLYVASGNQPGSGLGRVASGGPGVIVLDSSDPQAQAIRIWKRFFPGASNYEPFHQVGHYLFAVLAGLTGALIARRFQAARERRQTVAPEAVI